MSRHGRRLSRPESETISRKSLDDLEYKAQGGWFPIVSSLVRWLGNAGCNEYLSPGIREAVQLTHFPTPYSEYAALQRTLSFLGRIYNDPPPHLTPTQRRELRSLRQRSVLFVQHRLRQFAKDEEQLERVARNLEERLQAAHGRGPALSEDYLATLSGNVQRKLLRAVNGKGKVQITDVLKAVYGTTSTTKLEALLRAKDRANRKLAEDRVRCELRRAGEMLILSHL
jgi:hypothetical protein